MIRLWQLFLGAGILSAILMAVSALFMSFPAHGAHMVVHDYAGSVFIALSQAVPVAFVFLAALFFFQSGRQ